MLKEWPVDSNGFYGVAAAQAHAVYTVFGCSDVSMFLDNLSHGATSRSL